ncbi:MAG: hypothetical protein IJK68_05750 [Muribaculaceae bacterium]|nr:hypothetical protein [Muribaculaceae bacterium]
MTLKELKTFITSCEQPIDHIAGFCNSYELMFDRCLIDIQEPVQRIYIDTYLDDDIEEKAKLFIPVPEAIDKLLAMNTELDDCPVVMLGLDNEKCNKVLVRNVSSAKFLPAAGGNVGLCLLGREPIRFIDDEDFLDLGDMYHVEIVIEDPKAKKLNEKFCEFLHANCNWFIPNDDPQNDNWDIYIGKDVTFLDFITDEGTSANLIALITRAFDGAYFTRTLFSKDAEVERLSNDREGKYYKPYQAIVFPAYIPDEEMMNPNSGLTDIAGSGCFVKECASKDEMEQFIASLNPDEAVGDLVRRITTRYIDPLTLILE